MHGRGEFEVQNLMLIRKMTKKKKASTTLLEAEYRWGSARYALYGYQFLSN
jgi:hypothetical protein